MVDLHFAMEVVAAGKSLLEDHLQGILGGNLKGTLLRMAEQSSGVEHLDSL